jgi:hypothetical protein
MTVRYTRVNMADAIMIVLCEFDLVLKALALTTDNASSMIASGEFISEELEEEFGNLDFSHYQCAAHILNLAVSKGIQLVNESIEKVRFLMSYIKASHLINNRLKVLCNVKGINYLAPELDIKTRWNSTYYMLEKWKRMEPALNLLTADNPSINQRYLNHNDHNNINVSINKIRILKCYIIILRNDSLYIIVLRNFFFI